MRIKPIILSLAIASAACGLFTGCSDSKQRVNIATVQQGFANPPDSVRVACYWYWLNDNLSPEGVVKDLQAMKKAGITRAQIGMIGVDDVPYGQAKYNSDLWWETLHQALKTAGELDIEIGIFNSPGWSQSGGPWVKPEESMRHIVSSEIEVEGDGGQQQIKLPEIEGACQDEAVIAYPSLNNEAFSKTFTINKKEGVRSVTPLKLGKKSTIRSAIVRVNSPFNTVGSLKVRQGDDWQYIKHFPLDRYNAERNVGFEPYPPIYLSIPECEVDEMAFEIAEPGNGTVEIELSERPYVERNVEKSLAKMCQDPLPMWDFYMWETEPSYADNGWTIDPEKVLVLTDKVNDGVLTWDVPEGRWTVSRIGMATTGVTNSPATPEATGLEIDKINKEHLQSHFDGYIGQILERIPAQDRKTFKIVVEDSYETGGQNWTDGMTEKFIERYGYSPVPYLPVLQGIPVGSNEMSNRFLWDLRRLVADLVAYEYVGGLKEISNANGLTTWLENYGHWGFPAEFLQYGGQSDEISGEYWSEGSLGDIENRAASSCGHIYGKPKIWAESCTAAGNPFGRYPNVMKQRVDKFFTEGINASLLHLYIHQMDTPEEPGIAAWFGNEFNRKNTWFDQLDVFTDYLRRCNYVLQQGQYIADAAYFIGEDAPKMTGECNPALPLGYSFDYINAEILKDHAKVQNGHLVLDSGMEYRVLVLPKQDSMRPEMLECIADMVEKGLNVVGPAPTHSPSLAGYPNSDTKVKELASKLWKEGQKSVQYGKGTVWADGTTMEEIFAAIGLTPDMMVAQDEKMPLFIHRQLPDAEVYFVANPYKETISINPTFRVDQADQAGTVQLWDATNGEIRNLPQAEPTTQGVKVPMQLQPLESAFIVFRKDLKANIEGQNNPAPALVADLTNNKWNILFETSRRGPVAPIETETLFDWSTNPDPAIADYSGKAVYTTIVNLEELPQGDTYLDLGNVMVMGRVKVNGNDAGGVWTHPYRVNISPLLTVGDNKIEVEVVNTWHNRLCADAALPEAERLTWTNLPGWNPAEPRHSAGLMGPVKILSYPYQR